MQSQKFNLETDYCELRLHQEFDGAETTSRKSATREIFGGPSNHDPSSLPEATELRLLVEKDSETSLDDRNHNEADVGVEPTESEKRNLRHIGESLPYAAWLVAFVELCERFTFYGCQGLFQVSDLMIP